MIQLIMSCAFSVVMIPHPPLHLSPPLTDVAPDSWQCHSSLNVWGEESGALVASRHLRQDREQSLLCSLIYSCRYQ